MLHLQFETTLHMNVDSNILRGDKKKELSYQIISIFKESLPHLTSEHLKSLLTINVEEILNMVTIAVLLIGNLYLYFSEKNAIRWNWNHKWR